MTPQAAVALCMAAMVPRLAGCIADSASADPEARLSDVSYVEVPIDFESLTLAGICTHFVTVASDDHLQPMIDDRISAAICGLQPHCRPCRMKLFTRSVDA